MNQCLLANLLLKYYLNNGVKRIYLLLIGYIKWRQWNKLFSITYQDGLNKVKEFYPDYILKLKDGSTWLIETKGGETNTGEDKNIDKQIKNKFNAFKKYCTKHNLNWGFVRDKNSKLYINNTEYVDDLSDNNWKKLTRLYV